MTLSNPITMFGIHQATIEDRTSKDRSTLKVIGGGELNTTQDPIVNNGGSQAYPWGSENGFVGSPQIDLTVKQYDINTFKYFAPSLAASITEDVDGDTAGAIAGFANLTGSSVFEATTGIASIAITSGATPKFGSYIIKAASATTVDLYIDNDLDGATMVNDSLKITSTPITVPGSSATVADAVSGITLTGGSGSIAMTTGDMARVTVKPINNYNFEYLGGQIGEVFPEFKLTIFGEKVNGSGYRYLELPRVKASGLPVSFNEKDWSTFTTTITVMYDTTLGYAYKFGVTGR